MRAIVCLAIILLAACEQVWAECDVCQSSNAVACHSETVFSLCIDGVATRDYITCPEGSVCTDGFLVCYPRAESTASCSRQSIIEAGRGDKCGVCSEPNKVFSCIDETTIAFCFGNDAPIPEATGFCPDGTVCDITNPVEFCSLATEAEPSCIPVSTTTEEISTGTTSVFPRDPDTLCKDMGQSGSYRPDDDVTCTQFILCYQLNGVWMGLLKVCPGSQYFDSVTETCVEEKPASCGLPDETTEMSTTEQTTTTITTSTTEETTTMTTSTTGETTTVSTSITEETTTMTPSTTEETTTTIPTVTPSTTEEATTTTVTPSTTEEATTTTVTPSTTEETTTTTTTTTVTPSTTEEATTTTTSVVTPRDPDTLCQDMGQSGSYRPDDDETCTQYILCYELNGGLHGLLQNCPESQYFDSVTGICTDQKPDICYTSEEPMSTTTEAIATTASSTTEETTTTRVSEETTTTTPVEVTTESTSTTPATPRDPTTLCNEMGESGSYRPDGDTTCTKFVVCYELNGSLRGLLKDCQSLQYFDPISRSCTDVKPDSCT